MSQLPQVWPLFPPESLFPSDERGIWPDALDIQISTATDADVRSLKKMVSEHVQATCIGPRAHSSIQEMMHKTRLNPAPLLHRKKYTKAKPICSWTHSSKIQIFCCVRSIWKCKFEGKRWKWMCNLQIRRGSIGIFRRQIQDIIYSPPLWQQPVLLYCENLWCFCFNASLALLEYAIHTSGDLETPLPRQHWDGYGSAIPVAETTTAFSSLVLIFKSHYYLV